MPEKPSEREEKYFARMVKDKGVGIVMGEGKINQSPFPLLIMDVPHFLRIA